MFITVKFEIPDSDVPEDMPLNIDDLPEYLGNEIPDWTMSLANGYEILEIAV